MKLEYHIIKKVEPISIAPGQPPQQGQIEILCSVGTQGNEEYVMELLELIKAYSEQKGLEIG